jgi:hypothetical protein
MFSCPQLCQCQAGIGDGFVWFLTDSAAAAAACACVPQGYQTQDFEGIFRAMDGKPVTIRLLDPPLHEFLPQEVRC